MVTGERSCFAVPDCIIAFGVEARRLVWEARGCVISEIGKPPDVVMETASESAGVRDYTVKRRIYERMRAGEYWRFDPSCGQYQDAPLAGDILSDGEYRRIAITVEPDGTFWGYSPTLALYPVWDDGRLRFYAPATRAFLPDMSEAKRQTASERAARIMSERRAAEAEAELERLRRLLGDLEQRPQG